MNEKVKVSLQERSYEIHIRRGLLNEAGAKIREVSEAKKILLLSVPKVYQKYGRMVLTGFSKNFDQVDFFLIQDGEVHKNERTLFSVIKKLRELEFQRDSCVVSLGGGVVGDLGGLAASLYMRGIDFVQIPTTLLSQVDASIGGKTAIDFQGIKNLVGSFYQPKRVLIDPDVLGTLDDRQMRTGLAEIIKCGVIRDPKLFEALEKNIDLFFSRDPVFLTSLIYRSALIKAQIISEDEREGGKRMWLNYGHTLGHAIESYYGFQRFTHGEAIAYGMWAAGLISQGMGLCTSKTTQRQYDLLKAVGLLNPAPKFEKERVYQKMFLDKKARSGQIQFVLTRKIGLVTIQKNVEKSLIFSALNRLQVEMTQSSIN
jgi:3-dehydroquinate synthase